MLFNNIDNAAGLSIIVTLNYRLLSYCLINNFKLHLVQLLLLYIVCCQVTV